MPTTPAATIQAGCGISAKFAIVAASTSAPTIAAASALRERAIHAATRPPRNVATIHAASTNASAPAGQALDIARELVGPAGVDARGRRVHELADRLDHADQHERDDRADDDADDSADERRHAIRDGQRGTRPRTAFARPRAVMLPSAAAGIRACMRERRRSTSPGAIDAIAAPVLALLRLVAHQSSKSSNRRSATIVVTATSSSPASIHNARIASAPEASLLGGSDG
jgi:hypothetical protein